jgi:hypothetical protein
MHLIVACSDSCHGEPFECRSRPMGKENLSNKIRGGAVPSATDEAEPSAGRDRKIGCHVASDAASSSRYSQHVFTAKEHPNHDPRHVTECRLGKYRKSIRIVMKPFIRRTQEGRTRRERKNNTRTLKLKRGGGGRGVRYPSCRGIRSEEPRLGSRPGPGGPRDGGGGRSPGEAMTRDRPTHAPTELHQVSGRRHDDSATDTGQQRLMQDNSASDY